jgi:hypothetical protein
MNINTNIMDESVDYQSPLASNRIIDAKSSFLRRKSELIKRKA